MYGLILENLAEYIRQVYGEDRWEEIRRQASVDQPSFSVHQVYPENLIPRLAKKAIQVSNLQQLNHFFLIYFSIYLDVRKKLNILQSLNISYFMLCKNNLHIDKKYEISRKVTSF